MRKTDLSSEWNLKDVKVEAYVCEVCHGMWIEDSEAAKSIKQKIRASYFAGTR